MLSEVDLPFAKQVLKSKRKRGRSIQSICPFARWGALAMEETTDANFV